MARWHVIAGDDKRYARVAVIETVCSAIEDDLKQRGYDLTTDLAPKAAAPPS